MAKSKKKRGVKKKIKNRRAKMAWLKLKLELAGRQSDLSATLNEGDWLGSDLAQDGVDTTFDKMRMHGRFKYVWKKRVIKKRA